MKGVEQEGTSIVVAGRFNPLIFSPAWLRLHNLVGAREAEEATVQFIVPPAAVFSTEWLNVDVREDRMQLATSMTKELDRLRDVAIGILEVLKETPIFALGINRDIHWRVPSAEQYHRFGDLLAPKEFWDRELTLSGTAHLTVQGVRPDLWAGFIRVMIQPSMVVQPQGVYAQFNDHFVLQKVATQPTDRSEVSVGSDQPLPVVPSPEHIPFALEILCDGWTRRLEHANRVLGSLLQLSNQGS